MKQFATTIAALAGVMLLILLFRAIDIYGVDGVINHDMIQSLLLLAMAARLAPLRY
jgi:hypothetical protein